MWALVWSPLLQVDRVTVMGGMHTTTRAVVEAAAIAPEANLLFVPGPAIARRVERLPWVKSARVDRKLPGTVQIRITERRPALLLTDGVLSYRLDASGRVLTGGGAPGQRLPVLVTPVDPAAGAGGGLQPGTQLRGDEIRAALDTYRALPQGVRRRLRALFAPTPERITLSLVTGTTVRWGSATAAAAKSGVLRALLRRLDVAEAAPAYIDVRVPSSPAVSPT